MNMLNYIKNQGVDEQKLMNESFKQRDSFFIGKVTAVNDDETVNIKTVREPILENVAIMPSILETPKVGFPALYISSGASDKALTQLLGRSPFIIE